MTTITDDMDNLPAEFKLILAEHLNKAHKAGIFQEALLNENVPEVKSIINGGGLTSSSSDWGFVEASNLGNLDIIKVLLANNTMPVNLDKAGYAALLLAACPEHKEIFRYLIENTSISQTAWFGEAIGMIRNCGDSEIVDYLDTLDFQIPESLC